MRKFIFSVLFALFSVQAFAQITASFDFTVSVKGDYPIDGAGKAVVRNECYYVNANGFEIFCDGATRWVMDTSAKELTVENAENWTEMVEDYDLRYEGSKVTGASITLVDGTKVSLVVKNFVDSVPQTAKFSLDVSKLPDDYIVTDLRN